MTEAVNEATSLTLARIAQDEGRVSEEVAEILRHLATHLFDVGFRAEDVKLASSRLGEPSMSATVTRRSAAAAGISTSSRRQGIRAFRIITAHASGCCFPYFRSEPCLIGAD